MDPFSLFNPELRYHQAILQDWGGDVDLLTSFTLIDLELKPSDENLHIDQITAGYDGEGDLVEISFCTRWEGQKYMDWVECFLKKLPLDLTISEEPIETLTNPDGYVEGAEVFRYSIMGLDYSVEIVLIFGKIKIISFTRCKLGGS